MNIGQRIRQKREQKQMTLDELSKYVGVTRQTLSRYETGIINNIPSDTIEKIASALQTSPAYLMGWEDSEPPEILAAAAHFDVNKLTDEGREQYEAYITYLAEKFSKE